MTEETTDVAAAAPAPEGIISRAEALVHLEVAKAEAIAKIVANDVKNAIAEFLGALQRVPFLAKFAPTDHGVHLIASGLATKDAATKLVNSVQIPETPADSDKTA